MSACPSATFSARKAAGFRMAQERLGPERTHHCLRSIGRCEVALRLMIQRAQERQPCARSPGKEVRSAETPQAGERIAAH
jgi:alkylation response protein AidB-like acyl-CoA dehydrogenase